MTYIVKEDFSVFGRNSMGTFMLLTLTLRELIKRMDGTCKVKRKTGTMSFDTIYLQENKIEEYKNQKYLIK